MKETKKKKEKYTRFHGSPSSSLPYYSAGGIQ
jgi:hypothetical protein